MVLVLYHCVAATNGWSDDGSTNGKNASGIVGCAKKCPDNTKFSKSAF
jgi:hypothetical protein